MIVYMNIFLIGKTGLIGSAVYDRLKNDGHAVFSIGRNKFDYYLDMNEFSLDTGDLHADAIVHCAGITDEEIKNDWAQAIKRNTQGLVELVDWANNLGVSKFIYVSSAHVYGDLNRKINEQTEPEPRSLYSVTHLFAEKYIQSVYKNYIILRPNAVFGELPDVFKRWELIPFSFPRDLAIEKKIVIRSHGKQFRNFVSAQTIAKVIGNALSKSFNGVINPIGAYSMSVKEFAQFCIKIIKEISTSDFSIQALSEAEYINHFLFVSEHKQLDENPELLKEHIIKIYRKVKDENGSSNSIL